MSANLSGRKVELTEITGNLRPCEKCGCQIGTVKHGQESHARKDAFIVITDCGHSRRWLDQSEIDLLSMIEGVRKKRAPLPSTLEKVPANG